MNLVQSAWGKPLRLFIAIELPDEQRRGAAAVLDRLRPVDPDTRWVPPENLHITMKFLGEVPTSKLPTLQSNLDRVAASEAAPELHLCGLGGFPQRSRPRVLWLGVEGRLRWLAEQLDSSLERLGFARETRTFSAHLTLGRRRQGGPFAWPDPVPDAELGRFTAPQLALMESRLGGRNPVYIRRSGHPFQSAPVGTIHPGRQVPGGEIEVQADG